MGNMEIAGAMMIACVVAGGLVVEALFLLADAAERSQDRAREILYSRLAGVFLLAGVCALTTCLFVAL
jgi:hypothetical protein